MPKVDIPLSEVGNCKVDTFTVFSNCQAEFNKFCDVSTLDAGSVSIIDQDRDCHFLCVDLVFEYIGTIDSTSHAAAV